MAIFRIEKSRDYTVMSNYHLRDKDISLKAKGLLSQMLSLPEDWDYTLKGLAHINKESVDAVRAAVRELEQAGYIVRGQTRDEKGSFAGNEYVIHEQPQTQREEVPDTAHSSNRKTSLPAQSQPLLENPTTGYPPLLGNPTTGSPAPAEPIPENPTQINKDRINKDIYITDTSIYPSINQGFRRQGDQAAIKTFDEVEARRGMVKMNIEYEFLLSRYDNERLDELVEIIVGVACSGKDTLWVAGDEIPTDVVRHRLMKINSSHVEYVCECLKRNTTKVYNIKSYLLTALYNATLTIGNYYTSEANHDLYGSE